MTAIKLFAAQDPRQPGYAEAWECTNGHLMGYINPNAGDRIDGPALVDPEDEESARGCRWCAEAFDAEATPDGMIYIADFRNAGGWLGDPITLDSAAWSMVDDGSGS